MRPDQVLLLVLGALGAFDTLWYHERRARLVSQPSAVTELRLHALRDVVYAVLFTTLGAWAWHGLLAGVLVLLLACEVVITLADFHVEAGTRVLAAGERATHAVMGIVYGAFLATLLPEVLGWSEAPTGLARLSDDRFGALFGVLGAGVLLSGLRDAWAARALSRPGA